MIGTQNLGPLVVVSNRLPITLQKTPDDEWEVLRGSGGLVTALTPVLRKLGGLWVGWPGHDGVDPENLTEILNQGCEESGYRMKPVSLSKAEIESYYVGFCNEVLWMLFHDFNSLCNFNPEYWISYQHVNGLFAEAIAESSSADHYVWVHDYHLLLVAQKLQDLNVKRRTGFYLHIPFPPIDEFTKLPWRGEILQAMLSYDLIGFQTMRDLRNFLQCVHMLIPGVRLNDMRTLDDLKSILFRIRALVPGIHDNKIRAVTAVRIGQHVVRIGAFPISIDYHDFAVRASHESISLEVHRMTELLPHTQLILGIDRLDYSKGIPLRLSAFKMLHSKYPALRGRISLIQVVIPSRLASSQYQTLKKEIDRLVGEINGKYSTAGWTPVNYIFRSLSEEELLAYYRRCEIALVTPLKDGMNLVAKEFCACRIHEDGVLILSEFAGAAAQMGSESIVVNPFDVEGVADAIYQAFTMPAAERKSRMKRLRANLKEQNIYQWVDDFLGVAIPKKIKVFPLVEDFVPSLYTKQVSVDGDALP
jgi:trehalose 6-phosphate synthase